MTEQPVVLGPDDRLVLVTKVPFGPDSLADLRRRLPEVAADRLIVVDGSSFDAYVLRAGEPEPGPCGDPECHVLHADPANPIHPPFYVDSRT